MKKSFLAALDLALTAIFIGGGVALIVVGIWQAWFAHSVVTGVVLGVIGAALAGTPLTRLDRAGGVLSSQRRVPRMLFLRTVVPWDVTPTEDNPTDIQTPYNND